MIHAVSTFSDKSLEAEQDRRIFAAIERERPRLLRFIARRVANAVDAEDVLQDVFSELVEAYRLMRPIEQIGAWLFQVARNRITDLFRKRRPEAPDAHGELDDELSRLEDLLPSPAAGPDAVFARAVLAEALADALDELPQDQREVFIAHEIEGRSFRELSLETGLSVNTLLSRKHYAVMRLRKRLLSVYSDFTKAQGTQP